MTTYDVIDESGSLITTLSEREDADELVALGKRWNIDLYVVHREERS